MKNYINERDIIYRSGLEQLDRDLLQLRIYIFILRSHEFTQNIPTRIDTKLTPAQDLIHD